ncbi:MAG: DUF4339 domain-containing protein [Candidatus Accumulibacter sp.]|nr:DUF4339 domain-containing protein [Accumulibacter sp.]
MSRFAFCSDSVHEEGIAIEIVHPSGIAAMAASGALTRATMVWTAGQDGWKPAAATELARLLSQVPPPPPRAKQKAAKWAAPHPCALSPPHSRSITSARRR